jgi:hypothetical protein
MSRSGIGESSDLFRAVNERILELGAPAFGEADFICECADEACTRVLRMTFGEYQAMSSAPALHAVVPGHEQAGLEVFERTDRYVLVRALDTGAVAR